MPNWIRRAGGRPVVLRWMSKPSPTWTAARGFSLEPGTLRRCTELAEKYKLAGVVFDSFGPRGDNFAPPIDSVATAMSEIKELSNKYGFFRE